ncbi:L,D-transpeptidase family protein [Aurantiacibacter gangjinensis]|uniref:L,D-TPase catalytic domain-containing protein n=1 Tax=Aurantiacibacter gangjinensis TaxID=502682 RepID=A0A0G9MTY8_9SPHN|nr:L,D-transpeptidase family protein [Aurantiacibacter gangjinensis]APE28589.1 hypothetical protein BMF35_a1760 [Aurantiacibacter gangjinensis]KLE32778.1 hypothetical protein AAW01_01690 [Aurantiacibacter gangjinensis]
MKRIILPLLFVLPLAACGADEGTEADTSATAEQSADADQGYETAGSDNYADSMASDDRPYLSNGRNSAEMNSDAEGMSEDDSSGNTETIADSEERPTMQLQVVLDREGFGPGVIDGAMGMSTRNALEGFQEANGLEMTGELNEETEEALSEWERVPATRVVTIPASWGDAEYVDIPEDTAAKAEMVRLGYKSLDERLAERFHTTVEVLRELNPNGRPAGAVSPTGGETPESSASASATPTPTPTGTATASNSQGFFTAGQQIRVPNIGADRIAPGSVEDRSWQQTMASLGVGSEQPQVDRIVVSKSGSTLKAYQGDELVALFTVSSGSSEFPLPLGEWDIVGEAYNPPYSYDPEVLGLENSDEQEYTLPPGPNGPVGVVWIDLSKEHYGIHGTPDPETIGRAQSSGCVRLTNWDAARLSAMVDTETQVIFES